MGKGKKKCCGFCRKPLPRSGFCSTECSKKYSRVFIARWYRGKRYAWPELREFVLNRDGYRCAYCGTEVTMDTANIDHVKPWNRGGKTNPYNLVAICRDCNKNKGNRPAWAVRQEKGIANQRLEGRVAKVVKRWQRKQVEKSALREAEEIVSWLWK